MRRLAAASGIASLLLALMSLGGTAYDCRVDGRRHARCCCEESAGCERPSRVGAVERRCGCCTVVRFEPRELSPSVLSRTGGAPDMTASALVLPHPGAHHAVPLGLPAFPAPSSAHAPPAATPTFLAHRVLRL